MDNKFKDSLRVARGIEVDEDYYANSYLDNIYSSQMAEKHIRMFCKGEGKELLPKDGKKEKGACIYSSSMLAYNFFSWIDDGHPLEFDGVKYNRVIFEEQFRVLSSRHNRANLDVVLVSEDNKTILLIESKFTEHFKLGKVEISGAYYNNGSYFRDDNNGSCFKDGSRWTGVFESIRDKMTNDEKAYFEGIKQVACHLVGISNVIQNELARDWFNHNSWLHHIEGIDLNGDETFIFKSIIFCPNDGLEKIRSENYRELNKTFVSRLDFLPMNLIIDDPIITYRELWNNGVEKSITDEDLKAFLNKYLEVHE